MPPSLSHKERSILLQVANGNNHAFRQLFDNYRDKIYSVAYKLTKESVSAEDVVQEVFIKLWLHREKLPGVENFAGYLHTLTRNHIFSQLRKMAVEETYLQELLLTHQRGIEYTDSISFNELKKTLANAIAGLPPRQKEIYRLGKFEGRKYEEIAGMLHISKETVKDHMSKAIATIKQQISCDVLAIIFLILCQACMH